MNAIEDGSIFDRSAAPVVIAEIGANHDGHLEKAHLLVDEVARAGAKLVKFQLYTTDELVGNPEQPVTWGPPDNQRTESLGRMFSRLELSESALRNLFEHARSIGLTPFASAFSEEGVDTVLEIGAPFIKIAASDVGHLPLLSYIGATGKPVILSLGKCTLAEADEAVRCLEDSGCSQLALLHCVSAYPTPMEDVNLNVIPMLESAFPPHVIGFSDHSIGISAALGAVALGARIIEKHVTLSRDADGPDHWFSLEMAELEALVQGVSDVYRAMGSSRKRIVDAEQKGRKRGTRSLVAARDLSAGEVITAADIRVVRPGGGIWPKNLEIVLGMRLARNVTAGAELQWEDFKDADSGAQADAEDTLPR